MSVRFRHLLPSLIRATSVAEATQWTERVEACRGKGDQEDRIEAALAAFRAWRALGHPERAHKILEAWQAQSNLGSADYDFQPKGFVTLMLLAEGRVDEAWGLAPDPKVLFRLDAKGSGNIEPILKKAGASARFAALADCVGLGSWSANIDECVDRLEAEAVTPANKAQAARLAISSIWTDRSNEYGPQTYEPPPRRELIEARFRLVARLLRTAVRSDPKTLREPIDADALRALVRMSLDSSLIAERAASTHH